MEFTEIHALLSALGERLPPASRLTLIGGAALALLGSSRPTLDLDFIGDDLHPSKLHRAVQDLARQFHIQAEAVPLERFVPLPPGSEQRTIRIGQFGNLEVFVADPYAIALSKLDRGLDTDLDDLLFLLNNGYVTLEELERLLDWVLPQARAFDLNPEMRLHFDELKKRWQTRRRSF